MVPTTTTALWLLVVAVLPGSVYLWAFERHTGSAFGVTFADRVLRFVAISLVFDVLYAWPGYVVYRAAFADRPVAAGQFTLLWCAVALGLALPYAAGSLVGGLYATRTTRAGWTWFRRRVPPEAEAALLRLALGVYPASRAWDAHFVTRPNEFVRVRLRDGGWVGGRFGRRSSAGQYPHETDLLIEDAWPTRADGVFGDHGLGYAVYVPASAIAFVELLPPDEGAAHV
jgi:hypothetical protein